MFSLPRIAPVAVLLCSSVFPVSAQTTPETRSNTPAKTTTKTAAADDAEQQLKIRRAQARSLLISLATDARTFRDQTLRARSLARIADALWQVDAEQGRLMFRKAWEAAEVADQESDRKLQQEMEQQKARNGGSFAVSLPPNLRREVLRLAARHDRTLSEEFLEKLKTQKPEGPSGPPRQAGRLNEALSQRLSVAKELLQAGEMERALEFAAPALTTVGIDSINFLSDLREKNAAAADERYAALLTASAGNPQSDANTVSLLSSYIFTPHLFLTFSGNDGVSTSQMAQKITPAEVSPALRNAFFQAASSILLRPLPVQGQDQGSASVPAKYFVIKRLLPLFEQFAPSEMAELLRTQLNALNAVVPEQARGDDGSLTEGLRPEKPAEEREQSLLDRIDRAKTAEERDSLYIQLAYMAAARGDMKARDYVSKIDDLETRKQAQAYIDASLAMYAITKKQTDQALELVQKGDLTHLQKAWVLTQVAKIIAPADKDKATELVEEAAGEARRIEPSDPSRAQALIAVANALKEVDPARVWDATFEAVKAGNSAEGFTGEDGRMILKFQSKNQSSIRTSTVGEFDLEGIFRNLADEDYERAVELARGFEAEGPRAVATIAIARAILEPKKQTAAKSAAKNQE
jgi:hypothetical protein